MTWASRRQLFYISIFIGFFLVLGFIVGYPYFNQAPTCLDNKQNGDETGIDCGGSCQRACTLEVDKISVLWSRAFKVVPSRYNAVAYLENKNSDAAIYKIKYRFRFADKDNIFIGKREGETFIPPLGKFAVFEPAIDIGNSIPVYTTFEFTEAPTWIQIPEERVNELKVFVKDIKLENEEVSPKLSATITNNSLYTIPEVSAIAVLYDSKGVAISTSRTYIDLLGGGESADINFTWPEPIPGQVVTKEIIPMFNFFLVKFK